MGLVLGVDAGGTKTIAVAADESGTVRGAGRGAGANFQACGTEAARREIARAVEEAASGAGVDVAGFEAVCYGIAGADRPADFEAIRAFVSPLAPCPIFRLENDTIIALRAGTPDGVGIALIAGTGSNAIGRNAEGRKLQVGGLGRLSGDFGSSGQLAEAAIVAAIMGQDGRGPTTILTESIKRLLGLADILDVIEYQFYDSKHEGLDIGRLAPLVFEAATEGDRVALEILGCAGKNVSLAVKVILDELFREQDEVTIVFGGSIFQKGAHPRLIETISRETRKVRAGVNFVRLEVQPVLGAVNFAFDDLRWPVNAERWQRLKETFAAHTASGDIPAGS